LDALYFAFMGLLGSILYIFIWSKSFDQLKSFESVRHLVVGVIVGYLYSILHSDYNFPNAVMSCVAGYFGVDFVQGLFERLKARLTP